MPFNGSGTFNPLLTFVANTPATAGDQNSQDSDIATGLSTCITTNGQSTPTANIPMGTFRFTGLGAGSASTDSVNFGQVFGASGVIPTGTKMLFIQTSAPTGWTQDVTNNDTALRIVSGAGGTVHGSVGLSAFIANGALGHTLQVSEMPSHNHDDYGHNHGVSGATQGGTAVYGVAGGPSLAGLTSVQPIVIDTGYANISYTGGNGSHAHGLSDLQYIDSIVCTKN